MSDEGKRIVKAWGVEEILTNRPEYTAKRLIVDPGKISSLHRHHQKTETFIGEAGRGWIEVGTDPEQLQRHILWPDLFFHVEKGTWHRFWSEEGMTFLEISTVHSDEDVERLTESGNLSDGLKEQARVSG